VTATNHLLLGLARWIAGPKRAEWIDAMSAETSVAGGQSTAWAAGCVWATLQDRSFRETWFVLAILLMPIGVFLLQFFLFFPVLWFSHKVGWPGWTLAVVYLLLPLPFGFALGRKTSLRRSLIGAAMASLSLDLIGVMFVWRAFGQGPHTWFERDAHFYNMPPSFGWLVSLSVWLAGAWLGTRFPHRSSSGRRSR